MYRHATTEQANAARLISPVGGVGVVVVYYYEVPPHFLPDVSSSPNDDGNKNHTSRSCWLCALRRRSKTAIPGIAGSNRTERMDVSVVFIVLCRVGCGLCDRLNPR